MAINGRRSRTLRTSTSSTSHGLNNKFRPKGAVLESFERSICIHFATLKQPHSYESKSNPQLNSLYALVWAKGSGKFDWTLSRVGLLLRTLNLFEEMGHIVIVEWKLRGRRTGMKLV